MWKCSIQASRGEINLLSEVLAGSFASVSLFEVDEKQDVWQLEGLFEEEQARTEIVSRLSLLVEAQLTQQPEITFQKLPEKDWLVENRASFQPIDIGSFHIRSSFDQLAPPKGKTVLEIDASFAFGTGRHATTAGCLTALQNLAETYQFRNALDLGTGSAILAMAIASLYQCPTLATDIDADAIEVACANVRKNGYDPYVRCYVSDGFDAACFHNQRFDLIVANILAAPLIDLSADIVGHLVDSGILVLSGLLREQADDVLKAYTIRGLTLEQKDDLGEWSVLTLKKNHSKI